MSSRLKGWRAPERRPRPHDWVQLPFFVYGTLRPGQANYRLLLKGYTVAEIPAKIEGMALYSLRTFPIIVDAGPDSVVQGDLMVVHPVHYEQAVRALDHLEGYDPALDPESSLYRRVRRQVLLDTGGSALAWVYLGNRALLSDYMHAPIPDGDWLRYQRERARHPGSGVDPAGSKTKQE
jgi:gamma-glutamylcyclotransferase (GGCT)/AIG2-like uncharacterized protein YtfP